MFINQSINIEKVYKTSSLSVMQKINEKHKPAHKQTHKQEDNRPSVRTQKYSI